MVDITNSNGSGSSASERSIPISQVEKQLKSLSNTLTERFLLARAMGMTHGGKRDIYNVLGYDDVISWQQYKDRYDRGGIAARILNAYPSAVWRGEGEIIEDEDPKKETEFEKQWWDLNDQLNIWSTFQRAHVLSSIGSFSVILIGAPGDLSTELPKGRPGGILYLRPIGGGVVQDTSSHQKRSDSLTPTLDANVAVKEWDEDSRSRRFGLPISYNLKFNNFSQKNSQRPVHWSRIIHIPSFGFVDDDVFGPPGLQDVWNYLLDLDKVVGGGAEAFWMRANAGLHLNVDKDTTFSANPAERDAELESMRNQAEQYAHQMVRMIRTRGVDIEQLGSDVADFSDPTDSIITLISGTKAIPKRILTGSEMGQLASEQDRDNWNDAVDDVRTSYAHPVIVRPFIERLIQYGYLLKPSEWRTKWPESGAMSDVEKLDAATKMISLNDHGERVIEGNEVREFLGKEPFTPKQIQEFEDKKKLDREEEDVVDELETALRKGGTISIAVKG